MGVRGPDPEVGEDLLDDFRPLYESEYPYSPATPGTKERVHFVHLLDEACPLPLRLYRGNRDEFRRSGSFPLRPPTRAPADIAVAPREYRPAQGAGGKH